MRIGMIAGSGQFPILFSKKARLVGCLVYAAAIVKEADPLIERHVESVAWVHLGQVQKIIGYFRSCGIDKVVMLGAVDKTRMFSDARPDAKAIAILSGMNDTHDDALLRAFARAFKEEGVEIMPSTLILPELLAPKGCWTKRNPTADEIADIRIGYAAAKTIGSLDIGQSVVVSGGSVLAVEAIDGTDATIKRGGLLAGGRGAVVVKTSKPGQDLRFDVPAAGVVTICAMQEAGISALAVEAGKTVVFDREEMTALADRCKMVVVAIDDDSDQSLMKQR